MPEWIVEIADQEAAALAESFERGPLDVSGRHLLTEGEVGRFGGLKICVFSDEHPPPHFRVSYQGQSANFRISDCAKLNGGLDKFYRNIKKWHAENKQVLISAWDNHRPTGCPVGRYRG